MQVGPKYRPRYLVARMQHMVVVVPIDANVNEAQHVAQEYRDQWHESIDALAAGHLQLQHHAGDDDGDHAIAERFEPAFAHSILAMGLRPYRTTATRNPRRQRWRGRVRIRSWRHRRSRAEF